MSLIRIFLLLAIAATFCSAAWKLPAWVPCLFICVVLMLQVWK